MKIGIFDSGIGGLTVAKEIVKAFPHASIIYVGDEARVPYGGRSKEIVTRYAKEIVNFLITKKVDVIVAACNTVSAVALDKLKQMTKIPIIGMIDPVTSVAAKISKNKFVGVIGTRATINSKAYEKALDKIDKKIKVTAQACPLFVPLAEEGMIKAKATNLIAKEYLKIFKKCKIDTLILGCTHYPILQKVIQKNIGKNIRLLTCGKPAADELKKYIVNNTSGKPKYEFYVSDNPEKLKALSKSFFNKQIDKVSLVHF